ncbi:Hypothetical predicted protein [Mytilus galloprovincialis]|uniref:Retrotransposon gag domain-containing protein n=1 Tax=Mytilus galloprovincialis TaxID=29158 RepID=A0A8B6D3T9_MYTGA|nr:Hypothetical predicted protein [Mytilus galloprovincialis]
MLDRGHIAPQGTPSQVQGQSAFRQEAWHQGQSPGPLEGPSQMDSAFLEYSPYPRDANARPEPTGNWDGGYRKQLQKKEWSHHDIGDPNQGSPSHHMYRGSIGNKPYWPGKDSAWDKLTPNYWGTPSHPMGHASNYAGQGSAPCTQPAYTGGGQYEMACKRDREVSYRELVEKLHKRFGFKALPETAQVQFNNARQAPEESLEDWADRVLSLATRAFRNLPDDYMYEQAVMRLCQGIENKQLGVQISNLQPQSIEEAIDKIRLFQHNTQAIYGKPNRREVRQVTDGQYGDHHEAFREYQGPHVRDTMALERAPVSTWKVELEKSNKKFENKLGQVHEKLDDMMDQFKQLLTSPIAGSWTCLPGQGLLKVRTTEREVWSQHQYRISSDKEVVKRESVSGTSWDMVHRSWTTAFSQVAIPLVEKCEVPQGNLVTAALLTGDQEGSVANIMRKPIGAILAVENHSSIQKVAATTETTLASDEEAQESWNSTSDGEAHTTLVEGASDEKIVTVFPTPVVDGGMTDKTENSHTSLTFEDPSSTGETDRKAATESNSPLNNEKVITFKSPVNQESVYINPESPDLGLGLLFKTDNVGTRYFNQQQPPPVNSGTSVFCVSTVRSGPNRRQWDPEIPNLNKGINTVQVRKNETRLFTTENGSAQPPGSKLYSGHATTKWPGSSLYKDGKSWHTIQTRTIHSCLGSQLGYFSFFFSSRIK